MEARVALVETKSRDESYGGFLQLRRPLLPKQPFVFGLVRSVMSAEVSRDG